MLRLRFGRSLRCASGGILVCGMVALAGCAAHEGRTTGSIGAAPLQKLTDMLLTPNRKAGELSGPEADAIVALAIAEHEMRRP